MKHGKHAKRRNRRSTNAAVTTAALAVTGLGLPSAQAQDAGGETQPPSVLRISPPAELSAETPLRIRFSEPVENVTPDTVKMSGVPLKVTQPEPDLAVVTPAVPLIPGQDHVVTVDGVTGVDGEPVTPFESPITVFIRFGDTAPMVKFEGAWAPMHSSGADGEIFHRGAADGKTHTAANFTVRGTGVVVDMCLGPANGIAELWVDGVLRAAADTYNPYTQCRYPALRVEGLPHGDHVVQVRGIGAKNRKSTGTGISFDGGHAVP